MAKHYNQVTPKVPKQILIGLGSVLAVILGLFLLTIRSNEQRIYDIYKEVGADLTEEHPFYEVTFNGSLFNESIQSRITSGELFILYIGSPQCSACVQTIGTVSEYFYSKGVDAYTSTIFYYQDFAGVAPNRDRNAFTEAYPGITRSTPQLIAFYEGEIIATYTAPGQGVTIQRQVNDFFVSVINQVK
jgi:hypothetical protein